MADQPKIKEIHDELEKVIQGLSDKYNITIEKVSTRWIARIGMPAVLEEIRIDTTERI